MKLFYIIIFIITLFDFCIFNHIQAQNITEPFNASNEIVSYIESQMYSKYNHGFKISIFIIMDSILNRMPSSYFDERMTNPYNTLNGISIFSCQKENGTQDSSIIGVLKNGNLLWDSGPFISGNVLSDIVFCKDINKDNIVDIGLISELSDFSEGYNPNKIVDYLWILSWNGISGSFINEVDDITSKSNLIPGPFRLFDQNGDDVYEISSVFSYNEEYSYSIPQFPPQNFPYVTYGWNGDKYGLWPEVYQLSENDYYPAIWMNPKIDCKVLSYDSLLTLDYVVMNLPNSIQEIEKITIGNLLVQHIDSSIISQNGILSRPGVMQNSWTFSPELSNYSGLIEQGKKSNYRLKGNGLPSITRVYIQGKTALELTREISKESSVERIKNNSIIRNTIGLSGFPENLSFGDFLDSIKSYIENSFLIGWISDVPILSKYDSLCSLAKVQIQQNNNNGAMATLQTVLQQVDIDSTSNLKNEAYALIKYNTEYLLEIIPQSSPNLLVNLKNSLGNQIPASNVQYYENSWKDAVNNGDGTFTIITTKPKVSIRTYYEYASLQADNVNAQNNTYTFTTVNAAVQLKNSIGNLIDQGTVQYYAGAWRTFGTTSNGVAYKELLPINYSFRMIYEYGSLDKQQSLSSDPTVVFQTVNAEVQLKNSFGNLIDAGTVQYYAGAWRIFGTTSNGVAYKELLPINYSFRMIYEYGSTDKQQNLSADSIVVFQTVNAAVQLKNSLGNLIDQGTVQYYAGAWRTFGTTSNGVTYKELLPINYSFRMTYEYVSEDKQQNLSINPVVDFNTVSCSVKVNKTNDNQPINDATVKYYAGAWRNLGTTNTEGIATKELLPANISFRAASGNVSADKQQDISVNNLVEILLNVP